MGKLTKCPDCGSAVSKKAVSCPSCGRPAKKDAKSGGCLSGCVTIFLIGGVAIFLLALLAPRDPNRRADPPGGQPNPPNGQPAPPPSASATTVHPAVTAFLAEHPEFGTPGNVEESADWAEGKRQIIAFGSGKFFEFYERHGKIITVWETGRGRERVLVWGKPFEPEKFTPEQKPASGGLPAYKVLSVVQQKRAGAPRGPKYGEALITSLSRKTPVAERERVARGIAAAEGFDQLYIYSTEDAKKANSSASFADAHPNAMRQGYLGSLSEGKFTAGEETFP